ncbi:hypothetical protein pb186bvf_014877 [Paramecium bursaria]
MQNIFKREYTVTIGLEFSSKKVKIEDNFVQVQIWDTAGQEAFKSIVKSFFRNTSAIVLVYSISRSFDGTHFNLLTLGFKRQKRIAMMEQY